MTSVATDGSSRASTMQISAIVYVRSLPIVSAFYEQTLRLERVEVASTHVLLSRGAVQIALVQAPQSVAAAEESKPPELRVDTPLKLSFLVESFDAVRAAAARTGGSIEPESASWAWRGGLHLDGNDPEGNVVQFRVAEPSIE